MSVNPTEYIVLLVLKTFFLIHQFQRIMKFIVNSIGNQIYSFGFEKKQKKTKLARH